jgi:hypothetical protein
VHEAGHLDQLVAGVHQPFDELELDFQRQDRRLVLQAVARPDFADRHPGRQLRQLDDIGQTGDGHGMDLLTATKVCPSEGGV